MPVDVVRHTWSHRMRRNEVFARLSIECFQAGAVAAALPEAPLGCEVRLAVLAECRLLNASLEIELPGRPYRHCVRRSIMKCPSLQGAVAYDIRISARFDKGLCIRFVNSGRSRYRFPRKSKHRYACGAAEFGCSGNELSGAQLLLGLPSTRPPRPAAKVMMA